MTVLATPLPPCRGPQSYASILGIHLPSALRHCAALRIAGEGARVGVAPAMDGLNVP